MDEAEILKIEEFEILILKYVLIREVYDIVGDLFDHLILIREIKIHEFLSLFFEALITMDSEKHFLVDRLDPASFPQLDIAQEDLRMYNLEKMFRTIIRVIFTNRRETGV